MYNILTERLIRFSHSWNCTVEASLPEIYAALMADEIDAFPALRPHQRHAWHAFLVQLGVIAMHRADMTGPPTEADEWRRIIRALTQDEFPDDEPWHLVVENITKPAFMQPPATSKDEERQFSIEVSTPDRLDTLDTAKNHDIKRSVIPGSETDGWIFALITEQTTDAHMANNPAISRISGKGSRLAFSLAPLPLRMGTHVRRDITSILAKLKSIGENYRMSVDGQALLWTIPWDGKKQLNLPELHPLYIEVCRRRRLFSRSHGSLYMKKASGTITRIYGASAKAGKAALKGQTEDPWIPVDMKRGKALTLAPAAGFTYRTINRCLNLAGHDAGNWQLPLLCRATKLEVNSRRPMALVVRGISPGTGQNKTGGYNERIVPFRHRTFQVFGRPGGPEQLGDIARRRVDAISRIEGILKNAILTYACGGNGNKAKDLLSPGKRDDSLRKKADELTSNLDDIVDARFFNDLQDEFEAAIGERENIHENWLREFLIPSAEFILSIAHTSLPCSRSERFRALASSQNLFLGSIQQTFPNHSD